MRSNIDAYGRMLLAQYARGTPTCEIIERDDNYIDTGSEPGLYFSEYRKWPAVEKQAIKQVRGRVLDIGAGAGRHSLYLQEKGFDVTATDSSPGAVKVCKLRGIKKALVRPIDEIARFKPASFDSVIMMGNNFGLFGSVAKAKSLLRSLDRVTSSEARIIAGNRNPYKTELPDHLRYLKFNRKRGRMAGQIRIRARFSVAIGNWFDYLFVSPEEMEKIIERTGWRVTKFFGSDDPSYFALMEKQ